MPFRWENGPTPRERRLSRHPVSGGTGNYPTGRVPALRTDGPALVVAPASADLQVARGEALVLEAAAACQRHRGVVARLDVRLEAVQPQRPERLAQQQLHALGHVAVALEARHAAVAEERALQPAADDLAEVEEADEHVVLDAPGEEPLEGVLLVARHVGRVLLRRGRHRDPRPV